MKPEELARASLVAVYGYGREGRSVVRHVRATAPEAEILVLVDGEPDDETRQAATDVGFTLVTGPGTTEVLVNLDVDVVVRSPGVSIHGPALTAARRAGRRITTALNLWFALHEPSNVVVVTGTKGKSTTTTVVGHLLHSAGRSLMVGGNIGRSVLDLPMPPGEVDHVVLELSSYQLADLEASIAVGALLNLHPEHLDWHGSHERYVEEKCRIVDLCRVLVANADDEQVTPWAARHADVRWFGIEPTRVRIGDTWLPRALLAEALAASRLTGSHQQWNVAAALTVVAALGIDPTTVMGAVSELEPLPHRLQTVHDDGRQWVDDSISTIPETAVAAVDAFPDRPITLLAGGFDRGQDHAPLVRRLARREQVTVIAMPDTGRRLARDLKAGAPNVEVLIVDDLAEAVTAARRATPLGGVVLLSPAAPSYGAFRSFEERGDLFATLVRS